MCNSLRTQSVRGAWGEMGDDRGGHISLKNLLSWISSEKLFHECEGSCKGRFFSKRHELSRTTRRTTHDPRPTTHDPLPTHPRHAPGLQGHAPGAKLFRVNQRFHGYTTSSEASREQNFHPAKCSTIFKQLNIWEQAPGANLANLKTLTDTFCCARINTRNVKH